MEQEARMSQAEFSHQQEMFGLDREKRLQEIRYQEELHAIQLRFLQEEHQWKKEEHKLRKEKLLKD